VRECACDDAAVRRYRARVSGPLLDRIDLQVPVPALPWRDIADARGAAAVAEPTCAVRTRVEAARARQAHRYRGKRWTRNADLPPRAVREHCALGEEASALAERAVRTLGLSMRAYLRVLRVARTVADLAGDDEITPPQLAEALAWRVLDRSRTTPE
jgi:magnesium chelatase family protein